MVGCATSVEIAELKTASGVVNRLNIWEYRGNLANLVESDNCDSLFENNKIKNRSNRLIEHLPLLSSSNGHMRFHRARVLLLTVAALLVFRTFAISQTHTNKNATIFETKVICRQQGK